jgi:hypothetical protein
MELGKPIRTVIVEPVTVPTREPVTTPPKEPCPRRTTQTR